MMVRMCVSVWHMAYDSAKYLIVPNMAGLMGYGLPSIIALRAWSFWFMAVWRVRKDMIMHLVRPKGLAFVDAADSLIL